MTRISDASAVDTDRPAALVTGASRGLGLAIAGALAERGWRLVVDGRHVEDLRRADRALSRRTEVAAVCGDVADTAHREQLGAAVTAYGRLDVLVNNASTLGVSPLPPLAAYPIDELVRVLRVNAVAPLALLQRLLPSLTASSGAVVNVSSDAAVEAYPGWGGYGASKAALDQLTAVLAAENPHVRWYAVDPGDMRTAMHQEAFPGEDISDRPEPETVVPALLRLIEGDLPSGRYRAVDLLATADAAPRGALA